MHYLPDIETGRDYTVDEYAVGEFDPNPGPDLLACLVVFLIVLALVYL